jgi:hypothetical protein
MSFIKICSLFLLTNGNYIYHEVTIVPLIKKIVLCFDLIKFFLGGVVCPEKPLKYK